MMTCDACGFDVPPFTGQHTADDVLCADCLAKNRKPVQPDDRTRIILDWDNRLLRRFAEIHEARDAEAGDAAAVGEARSGVAGL